LERLPGVMRAELRRNIAVRLSHGHRTQRASIFGIDEGSDLSGLNDANGNPVTLPPVGLVLSDKMAELLAASVGDQIHIQVLEDKRPQRSLPVSLIVKEYIGTMVYMNRAALHDLMMEAPSASAAYLKVDPVQSPKLYAELKELPVVTSVSRKEAALDVFQDMLDDTFIFMVSIYIGFATIISVGVVYNSARISLAERARELASMRVMGFHKAEVGFILLGELAVLVLLSLPLGTAIGYGLAFYIAERFSTDLYRLPLTLHLSTVAFAVTVVIIASVFTALIVTRRVNNLDLVSVLKTRE